MSKRFVYRCVLAIFFASMNLLSMHDYQLSTSLTHSRYTKKEAQNYKDTLFSSPSSVPYFRRQSIALQNNDSNQYPLIFNRNQQPCITQYLLEGIHVAKLIQIDDEINFESDSYRACNFSLQIPYHAGSLTINTQGQFIFEKKIDTHSACLTCKTVDFRDEFFSENGLIVEADGCKNNAPLACSDFLFKGKNFEITSKSSLNTHKVL